MGNDSKKQNSHGRLRNLKDIWIRMKRNKLAMVGLVIIIFLVLVAIFADQIAPYSYAQQDLKNQFQLPSAKHWFGTDDLGRDIFSRVVYGSRVSLKVGFISVSISLILGVTLGALTGYYGGKVDILLMRVIDILQAVPDTLLAIAIMAALGPGLTNLMMAVGIASIPSYARLVRSSVLSIRDMEFIEAAKANGSSDLSILFLTAWLLSLYRLHWVLLMRLSMRQDLASLDWDSNRLHLSGGRCFPEEGHIFVIMCI